MLWAILALFVWLFSQTLAPNQSSGSGSSGATTTLATSVGTLPFTIDGRPPSLGTKPLTLREGQVVRFRAGAGAVRITRLECAGDVHRLPRTWHVPDLPEGPYALDGSTFGVLVQQHGHAAPCP